MKAKPKPKKKTSAKLRPLRIVGGVFVGPTPPDREAITYSGRDDIAIKGVEACDAATLIRLVDCGNIKIIRPRLARPLGPPDPDGQCIQIIRPRGLVLIEDPECVAGPRAEDLISIFADRPVNACVRIRGGELVGRGGSHSSTSIIADGQFCPPVEVTGVTIRGARVAVQLAGGEGHYVHDNDVAGCVHDVEVCGYYPEDDPRPVLNWRAENTGRINWEPGCAGVADGRDVG